MGTKPPAWGQSPQMPSDGAGSVEKRSPGAACRRGESWLCPSRGAAARCAAKIKRIRHLVRGKMSVFIGRRWNLEAILSSTQRRPLQKCRALRRTRPSCTRLLRKCSREPWKAHRDRCPPAACSGHIPTKAKGYFWGQRGSLVHTGLPTQDGDGDTATGWQQMPPLGWQQRAGDRAGGQGWGPPPQPLLPSAFHPFFNPQIATSQGDANKGHFYCHLRPHRTRRPTNLFVTQSTRRWGFGAVLLGFGFRRTVTPLSPRPARRLLSQKGPRSSCTRPAWYCQGTSTNLRRPPTTP